MNKRIAWWAPLLVLAMLAMPWAGLWGKTGLPTAVAQTTVDQEIVYLDSWGRVKVHDPYVAPGTEAVVWQSSGTGWTAVATGDFNGDGDDEIIAIKGTKAKVFDPVVQPGRVPVSFEQTLSSPFAWELVATGDIDADGRDEIILTRTDSAGSVTERLTVWDGNANGTSWTKIRNNGYGCSWEDIATGDVNADGRDDIALIRQCNGDRRLTILNPVNWSTLHDASYSFPWLDVAICNTHRSSGADKAEIVLTRSGVIANLNSYWIFRWTGGTSLQDVAGEKFYPYFTSIACGDVNNSGDDEVFLVRDPQTSTGIALIMRNYGSDAVSPFEASIGRTWKAIVAGDVNANGRADLVVLSSSQMRIYTSPDVNQAYTSVAGSFRTSGRSPIALGNLDGQGVVAEPELGVTPTSFTVQLEAGSITNRTVNVTNTGAGGSFSWTATVTAGSTWLSVTPTSGATPALLTLQIDATSLAPGTYVGRVRITATGISGSPKDVTVTLTVQPRPFNVSPTKIVLTVQQGMNYVPPQIEVEGTGVSWVAGAIPAGDWNTLAAAAARSDKIERVANGWRVGEGPDAINVPDVPWLILTPYQGTAPSVIYVTIDETQIQPGLYRATIVIDGGPNTSPRFTGVDFTLLLARSRIYMPMLTQ